MKQFILLFFSIGVLNAQNDNSTQLDNKLIPLHILKSEKFQDSLGIKNTSLNFNISKSNQISVYNETTMLNDFYASSIKGSTYVKSKKVSVNTPLRGTKVDAFNPYGVSNSKEGVIMGAFGVLLKKVKK